MQGQIFDQNGLKKGSEIRINDTSFGVGHRVDFDLTFLEDEEIVVCWAESRMKSSRTYKDGVYAQRFDLSGNKVGVKTIIGGLNYDAIRPALTNIEDDYFMLSFFKPGGVYSCNISTDLLQYDKLHKISSVGISDDLNAEVVSENGFIFI